MNQNIYNMEISPPWVNLIFSGRKRIEMRKNNPEKWGKVKTGDILIITGDDPKNSEEYLVMEVRKYKTLEECFISEGVRNLLPGLKTIKEAEDVYLGFDGLDKIEERRKEFEEFGCIVIEIFHR